MLEAFAIILSIAGLLGISSTHTLGGMIHDFPSLAAVSALLRNSKGQSRP